MGDENEKYVFYGGSTQDPIDLGCRSLGELIIKCLKPSGDNVAYIDAISGAEITFAQVLERSVRLAARFTRIGLKKDNIIAIMCENRVEMAIVILTATYMNAIPLLLNPTYTTLELEHVLKLTQPRAAFVSAIAMQTFLSVAKNVPSIRMTVQIGSNRKPNSKIALYSELFDRNPIVNPGAFVPQAVNLKSQVGLMVLSSGTTGLPKAIELTHYNLMAMIAYQRENIRDSPFPPYTRCLGLLPFYHVYGYMMLIGLLCNQRTTVILPKFEPDLFLSTIEKHKVVSAPLAPPLMVFLAKDPRVDRYDLSSLAGIGCGAAPLSKELEQLVMRRLPNLQAIRTGYGLSESQTALVRVSGKPGSVGVPNKYCYVKVVDIETGATLGPNQVGEICVKSPLVMKGYFRNEKETRAMIDEDGWLHSGDTGYFDEDGEFFIVDRIKELIKCKGFQVAPAELEAVLLTNPKIKDAGVVGVPDEVSGELPMAFVVPQSGVNLTEAEVKQWIADQLSSYKQLRGGVRFVQEIPKSNAGKILRRELRAMLTKAKL